MAENEITVTETSTQEVETVTCSSCGCTSTLPQLFRKSWGKQYCPACVMKNEVRNTKFLFLVLGFVFLFASLINAANYGWLSWEAWIFEIYLLVIAVSLALHEFSHALAAKLLGGRVFGIQLGIGPQLLRRWFKGFYLGINLFQVSGVCFAGFPTNKRLRLRYAIYISGGLIFHIVSVFIAILLVRRTEVGLPLLIAIIVVNGFLLFLNILPITVTTAVGQTGSDGMLIWRLLRGKLTHAELQKNYYRLAATFAHQQQNTEEVNRYVREGLSQNPSDEVLENLRVYMLLNEEDKLEEAYAAWKEIVESADFESKNVLLKAIFYNNYAWATLMHRPEPDSLEVARHYSDKAFEMVPWVIVVKGTLAAIMVEQGEHREGAEFALAAAKEMENEQTPERDKVVAANLATAALGYYRMGGQETAVQYLAQALALDPDERFVQKAAAEIEEDVAPNF